MPPPIGKNCTPGRQFPALLQRPEPCRSPDAAGISVLRRKNVRVRFSAKNILFESSWNILVNARNLRCAPAQNNHLRIQKINDLCQTAREPVFESIERGQRGRFSSGAASDNLWTLERYFRRALVIRRKPCPGNPGLNAAISSAVARRSGILFGAHPGQCVVSPFTRHSVPTAVDTAIDGDSSAAARSEDHRENDMLARASSVGRFGNSKAVRVICATHLASQR